MNPSVGSITTSAISRSTPPSVVACSCAFSAFAATRTLCPGTDFTTAISLGLTDAQGYIILNEDGTVTINFVIPEDSRARSYSILFWDTTLNNGAGGWVQLPPYEVGTSFPLNPDDPNDNRTIISGVKQVGNVVTVTVDFSGVFALVSP